MYLYLIIQIKNLFIENISSIKGFIKLNLKFRINSIFLCKIFDHFFRIENI
jgi:hypothetical protein